MTEGALFAGQLLEVDTDATLIWTQDAKKRHFAVNDSAFQVFGRRGKTSKANLDMRACLSVRESPAEIGAPDGAIELAFRSRTYLIVPDHSASQLLGLLQAAVTCGTGPSLGSREHSIPQPAGSPENAPDNAPENDADKENSPDETSGPGHPSGSIAHTLLRKQAIARGGPTDLAGSFVASVNPDFDINQTIFKTLPHGLKRMVQRTRLDSSLEWTVEAEAAINEAFKQAATVMAAILPAA